MCVQFSPHISPSVKYTSLFISSVLICFFGLHFSTLLNLAKYNIVVYTYTVYEPYKFSTVSHIQNY